MNGAAYWHFYFRGGQTQAVFCTECQEYHTKEEPGDELALLQPKPGVRCDGCGRSPAEVGRK